MPNTTTPPDYWLVTNVLFARSYQLAADTDAHDGGALTAGAITAVAVGTVLAVVGLVAVLVWMLVHRRRSRASPVPPEKDGVLDPAQQPVPSSDTRPPGATVIATVEPPKYTATTPMATTPVATSHERSRHGGPTLHELEGLGEHPVVRSDADYQRRLREVAVSHAHTSTTSYPWSDPQTPRSMFDMLRDPENDRVSQLKQSINRATGPHGLTNARGSLVLTPHHDDREYGPFCPD